MNRGIAKFTNINQNRSIIKIDNLFETNEDDDEFLIEN